MRRYWILIGFFLVLFWELIFKGFVAAPVDTLVGAYYPWLAHKWGYITGVPVKNAMLSDVFSQFFIWKHIAADLLLHGHLPLWNPSVLLGTPFLATFHSAVLFPGNVLLFLPKYLGWNFYIIGSAIFSSLGMHVYLSNRLNKKSALIGSVVFALGGPMTTWSELGTAVWAISFLPWIFYCLDVRKFKFISPLVLALILAGNVQICTYAVVLIGLYILTTVKRTDWFRAAIFALLGLGLSAIQLLPTASFYQHSIRSAEKYTSQFNYGLSPASQLIRFIAPDIFGHPSTGNYQNEFSYHEYTGFFGTLSLILALYSIFYLLKNYRHSSKIDKFFVWTFLLSIFLSVESPFTHWLFSQPLPLLTYSSASRIYFVVIFSAAYLSSRAFLLPKKHYLFISLSSMLLVSLIIQNIHIFSAFNSVAVKNSLIPFVLLFLSGLLYFLPKKISLYIFLLLTILDLGRYYRKYNPFISQSLAFPATATTEFLSAHTDYAFVSLSDIVLPSNTWMMYGTRSFEGYDPLHLQSFNSFSQVANSQHYVNSPSRYVDITTPNFPLLRAANVGYYAISSDQKKDFGIRKWPKVFSADNVDIYQDPQALPYIYLPKTQSAYTNTSQLIDHLESSSYDPNTIYVHESVTNKVAVVATNFDDGWYARDSENKQLKTTPVNGTLLGIELLSNTQISDIRLTYFPKPLFIGGVISLFSLIVYICLAKYTAPKVAKTKIH